MASPIIGQCPYIAVLANERTVTLTEMSPINAAHHDAQRAGEPCPHCETPHGARLIADLKQRLREDAAVSRLRAE